MGAERHGKSFSAQLRQSTKNKRLLSWVLQYCYDNHHCYHDHGDCCLLLLKLIGSGGYWVGTFQASAMSDVAWVCTGLVDIE